MYYTFPEFLRESLSYLDFGSYPFEIVYRQRPDGMIGWSKFAPRLPKTIYGWEMENGEPGVQQQLVDGGIANIPIEKLFLLVNEQEGDNYEGRSILRSSYRHWYSKDKLYQIDLISLERQGSGIPTMYLPENAGEDDKTEANKLLKNIRTNEQSFLRLQNDWKFEFSNVGNRIDPSKSILHHDRQIVKNVLAQFIDLGGNGGGSYALSKDQSGFFLLGEQYIANYWAEAFTQQCIKRLIDINFGPQDVYPFIEAPKIGQTDHNALTTSLQRLMQTGVIQPDTELEMWVRNVMELPALPEGTAEERELMELMNSILEGEQEMQALENEQVGVDEFTDTGEEEFEDVEANDVSFRDLMNTIMRGALGKPLDEEHRSKISESLKKYWQTRKKSDGEGTGKGKKGKGKGGGKGKGKSEEEKKAAKEKQIQKKTLRAERKQKIKEARREMRKLRDDMQVKLLERKAKGEKIEPEEMAKMKLNITKQVNSIRDKIDQISDQYDTEIETIDANDSKTYEQAINAKERLDKIIESLEK
jgi:hypothetical protein